MLLGVLALLAFAAPASSAAVPQHWTLVEESTAGVRFVSDDGAEVGWVPIEEYVATRSASGCNRDVCIDVTGEDLFVSSWKTQAFGNVGCTKAYFHSQSFTVTSPQICSTQPGDGVYFYNGGPAGYYQDGEDLCNNWDFIEGYPCIEVHD